jgi:dihydrofolate reductase
MEGEPVSKVRIHMMMSLDGYVAGLNQSLQQPFGDIPDGFLDWVFRLKSFREHQGMGADGAEGPTNDVIRETGENLGATIMGRHMFGGGTGPWDPSDPWKGWWGDNPVFHTPVFVLTHYPRERLVMEGGTEFVFVTDGIESALRQAKEAAGDRDVRIGGGGNVANQYIASGLVDEIEVHVVPVLIGAGERLFEGLGDARPQLELIRTMPGTVSHLKYRVVK